MYATSRADGSAAVVLMDGQRCRPVAALPWCGRNGWDVGVRKGWSDNSPDITQAISPLLVTLFRGWLDPYVRRLHLELDRRNGWQ